MPAEIVEDPVLRQRYSFGRSVAADGSEVLDVDLWIDPGGGVTPHIHPAIEERFEVVSGRPRFLIGRRWRTAGPGETVVVAPGTRHAYRNGGDGVAHVVCRASPPSTLQEFLEEAAALNRSGALTRQAVPRSVALLACAVLAHRHREMVVLLFPPLPPPRIARLLVAPLARLGLRRNRRQLG